MGGRSVVRRSGGAVEDACAFRRNGESRMSSFGLYLIGAIVLIGGLVYAAWLVHVPSQWIVVGAVIVLGACILGAVTHTRRRDPPA
jgi:hypothetical protein